MVINKSAILIFITIIIFINGCISHNEGINDILIGGNDIEVNALFNKIDNYLSEKKYTEALSELNGIDKGMLDENSLAKANSYYAWLYYQTQSPSQALDYIEKNTVDETGDMVKFFSYWSRRYNADISKAIDVAEKLGFSDPSKDYTKMNNLGVSEGEIHAMLAFCYYLRASSTDMTMARSHIDRAKQLNLIENSYSTSEIVKSLDSLIP